MILIQRRLGLAIGFFFAQLGWAAAPPEIQIERTYLPDAAPSAFAIGFSNGVNFCYDPIRGGLNYAWSGGFIDLTAVRPGAGKTIKAATLLGQVVYREKGAAPLRVDDSAHQPIWQFRGYHLGANVVEFRYTVDGTAVTEEIRPLTGGDGLRRRFQIGATGIKTEWWYQPGPIEAGEIVTPTGKRVGDGWKFLPDARGEFVVEIHFAKGNR